MNINIYLIIYVAHVHAEKCFFGKQSQYRRNAAAQTGQEEEKGSSHEESVQSKKIPDPWGRSDQGQKTRRIPPA